MRTTSLKPTDVLKAIAYPLTEFSVAIPLITLWLLVSLAVWGGILGLFLLFLVIPAVFRYQMIMLGARATGATPATPGAEFFDWFGNAWTLFPVVVAAMLISATIGTVEYLGTAWTLPAALLASVLFSASIAVLAITRSPLQSLNPIALARLLRRCAATFWIAPAFLVLSVWLSLQAEAMPMMIANLLQMYLSFAFFSLTGSLIEPYGLMAEVSIPDALQSETDEIDANVEKERTAILNHAYGFISRGNRAGGFRHVTEWAAASPDPRAAWAWFFERMLAWENQEHALFFAQLYIHDMLGYAENIPALKVLMRCRLISERFRPLSEDLPAIIEVAQASGNIELAAVLKRN